MLLLDSPTILHGANRYSRHSVLVGTVRRKPPLPDGLTLEVDSVWAERCDGLLRDAGIAGLLEWRAESPTTEAVAQMIAMSLMSWVGLPDIDPTGWVDRHPGTLVIPGEPEALARECATTAILALSLAMETSVADIAGILRNRLYELEKIARKHVLPIQTGALAEACRKRGIGWRRINAKQPLFQLGEGARQCRLDLSVSTSTSRLATDIARDKFLANKLLARFGLPVSRQIVVTDADAAWRAAQEIGLPAVVKPRQGNMGKGVSVHLTSEEEVRGAVRRARPISKDVIVETYLPGDDHRIPVAGRRIVAVARRMPAHVVGDGTSDIRELLDRENADPRRSKSYRTMLMTIEFDSESEQLLAERGYDLDTVPTAGEVVPLKSAANWTAGGTTFDCTDLIHPDNAAMVIRATDIIGLDIAGVDLLIPDIGRSYREVGGGICEVNYRPGILVHLSADGIGDRDVAGDMIDAIYRQPRQGRIGSLVVCMPSGAGQFCDEIAKELRQNTGFGVACYDGRGLRLDGWPVTDKPLSPRAAHELAVCDPTIDAMVFAVDSRQVVENGLGFSHLDVAVVPGGGKAPEPSAHSGDAESIFRLAGARLIDITDPAYCARALIEAMQGEGE